MRVHVGIMAHAIPDAIRVAVAAMVVFGVVDQPVLVTDRLILAQPHLAVSAGYIPDGFLVVFLQGRTS